MLVKLESCNILIGKFLKDYGIEDTTYVDDYPRWIVDGLEIMCLSSYCVTKKSIKQVVDNRCALPCDLENIIGVWPTYNLDINQNINNLNKLTVRNMPLIGQGYAQSYSGIGYATIDNNFLHTSFPKGNVMFVYKGIPTDCDGLPLVPKDAKVYQALSYYLLQRMMLTGYKHPIFAYKDLEELWRRDYPAAANSVNWMDLGDLQEFVDMWTNPLRGDLNANNGLV